MSGKHGAVRWNTAQHMSRHHINGATRVETSHQPLQFEVHFLQICSVSFVLRKWTPGRIWSKLESDEDRLSRCLFQPVARFSWLYVTVVIGTFMFMFKGWWFDKTAAMSCSKGCRSTSRRRPSSQYSTVSVGFATEVGV